MDRARIVRQIGELLSSQAALRDAWPECSSAVASLLDAGSAQIVPAESDQTRVLPANGAYTVTVPLRFDGQILGAIELSGARTVDDQSLALLEACAFSIGARLHYERFTQSSERLAELARIDPLTGIANRRRFDEVFDAACLRARVQGTPLSLAVIDIDYFKAFNDGYGHQAGDAALRSIAAALQICVRRPDDVIARFGGEEFVVLLPGATLDAAIAACEHACDAVAQLAIVHAGSSLGHVSISAGVATLADGYDSEQLFHEADDALYRAKLGGRNRVAAAGYVSADAPAERVLPRGGTNLPEPPNKLIGRVRELRELAARMLQHRSITITGIGGCGKTRIAIEAASRALPHFEDGVWFIDFTAVGDASLVTSAVSALFDRSRDSSPKELLAAIGNKQTLLLFDNCETLLRPIAQLTAEILQYCPRAHVLATSREQLGVNDELAIALAPLEVPPAGIELGVADTVTYDAVALFIERIRDANAAFIADARAVETAASICRRLDGIPLALELAAPRAAAVGLERLDADLQQHPTMRSVIAWSYAMLPEHEARVFHRLAIFNGGFRIDAAIDVCWDAELPLPEVAAIIERLARKSLIVADNSDTHRRFRMLETIREFALDQLREHRELRRLQRMHAQWVLAFARKIDFSDSHHSSRSLFAMMTPELDNFRSAIAWAFGEGGDAPLGCTIVASLLSFMHEIAPGEGTRWGLRALERIEQGTDPPTEAALYYCIAAMRQLPAVQLRDYAERSVELYRAIGDRQKLGRALRVAAQLLGWYFRAERERADELAIEAIAFARELDDPTDLVNALRTRGLTIDISDFPAKRAVLVEALALARTHNLDRAVAGTLTWISEMEFSAGEHQAAYEYGREAVQAAEASGSRDLYATAVTNFATYAAVAGEFDDARNAALSGLRVARATMHAMGITYAIQALALVSAGCGDPERAARLIGFCDARDGVLHAPRQADQSEELAHRSLLAQLHTALGKTRFDHLYMLGKSYSEDQAVEEALRPLVRS